MSLIGYARVPTVETAAPQHQALAAAGCEHVYTDVCPDARAARPRLAEALDHARAGDTLVVWRLDRLGRSLSHLVATIDALRERRVGFRSLTESIDVDTARAFAQFERALAQERIRAGLDAARANGRCGGRPRVLTPAQVRYVRRQRAARVPVAELAAGLSVGRATIYRALADA